MLIGASLRASKRLRATWPRLSAATLGRHSRTTPLLILMLALLAMFNAPSTMALSILVVLPATFRIWIVVLPTVPSPDDAASPPDEQEPVYSIVVPLRGEARVVDQLLSAIERLNYPREKLDVIVAVEARDHSTRAAITARKHRISITVVPVPAVGPMTKPKALNVALPFARGDFTVIYDAEDRPERNQLRAALKAFQSGGGDLACVQARLCVDTKTGWLARYFTAEYAGQFDVFLPKLAALDLPLPLGGSSNHFRTSKLREVGGWDPHNVTEDADLGMRLARFGYRSGVVASSTYEEAPADIGRWLGQRTRWFKGWMQTWLVHMRRPHRLFRELGPGGFLVFQLIIGGNALVALVHPILVLRMIAGSLQWGLGENGSGLELAFCLLVVIAGYLLSACIGFLGLAQRGLLRQAGVLALTPLHWLLLSIAAWRAAVELVYAPFRWTKTEHGLDKASREKSNTRSLLELEHLLRDLKRRGELAQIQD
jgi:cellulose synthase/poly-beta-1,6-N-acetylglucosamine synthase-like glycosyltransferase